MSSPSYDHYTEVGLWKKSQFRNSRRNASIALLEQVRKTKRPILVTRFGNPVAEVIPPPPLESTQDWLGTMADTIKITGDTVSPVLVESDWEGSARMKLLLDTHIWLWSLGSRHA